MNAEPEWIDGNRFRLAGESFGTGFDDSTTDRIVVCKPRPLVEATIALMRDLAPRRIFELGIFNGGSVALNALVVDPDLLVAVDISEERIAALDHLLARRGLDSRVRLYYGVDQADRDRIAAIATTEAAGARYDLVVDDASHRLDETRSSFETLFPMLRPGGLYVIEDWNWQLRGLRSFRAAYREAAAGGSRPPGPAGTPPRNLYVRNFLAQSHRTPLERLAVELVLAQACDDRVITSVRVDRRWITVERGPADLDPATFRVADHFVDYTDHRSILAHPDPA